MVRSFHNLQINKRKSTPHFLLIITSLRGLGDKQTSQTMRKLFYFLLLFFAFGVSSCTYDDTSLWEKIDDHESRISRLEELCREMNTNITALQTLVEAMQEGDYITGVAPITENGQTVGYTITFKKSEPITIYHGKDGANGADGADGKDGYTPLIGVKQDTDGVYYWTLDGEWLLDKDGNKVKAVGADGKDGANGADGTNGADGADGADGTDGKDGITPQLKIENDYWYISYDNGASWTELGKATGEDGKDGSNGSDGQNGKDGDSLFASVSYDDDYVYFVLADGTSLMLPRFSEQRLDIVFEEVDNLACYPGASVEVGYTIIGGDDDTNIESFGNGGWSATVIKTSDTEGKIRVTAPEDGSNGKVVVLVTSGGDAAMRSLHFDEGILSFISYFYEVGYEACTLEVELTTNIDYIVEIPEEAQSWLSVADTRAELREDTLTFTIAENQDGDLRSTWVLLTNERGDYLQSFEIVQYPQPAKVEFTAKHMDIYPFSENMEHLGIYLSDLGFDEYGNIYPGGTYVYLEVFIPPFDGEGEFTLPVGTYTFNNSGDVEYWSIVGNCFYANAHEDGYLYGEYFDDATLVVTETGLTLTATTGYNNEYTIVFNYEEYNTEPKEITVDCADASYYGDVYTPGVTDNFYFFLSDLGLDEDGSLKANGNYYLFDIYTDILDTTNGIVMPDGEYVFDMTNSYAPGTFSYAYSRFYTTDEYGVTDSAYYDEGHLVKEGNKITATVVISGVTYIINFEGDVVIYDFSTTEDDPENPTPGEGMSTLTGDIELDITNAAYALQYYGDYFSYDTDNWMLYIYEDTVTMDGAFIMLDLLADPNAADIAGTYTADNGDDSYAINTYFPGYVDGDDMYGVWYTEMVEGVDITAMAPIADGEIKIECAGNTYTITFDCVDDKGNKIAGTIVANPLSEEPMAAALSVKKPAKQSRKASVEKPNSVKKSKLLVR